MMSLQVSAPLSWALPACRRQTRAGRSRDQVVAVVAFVVDVALVVRVVLADGDKTVVAVPVVGTARCSSPVYARVTFVPA